MSQPHHRPPRGSDHGPNGQSRRNAKGRQRHRGTAPSRSSNTSGSGSQQNSGRKFSKSTPSQRRRQADPARLTAYRVLRAVSAQDSYANLVLPAEIRRAKLNQRDAGFATELAYGTLRSTGTYDAILDRCVDRPLDEMDSDVLDALRLGVHQLLAMRVNTHAAVNETVGLVRDQIGAGPGGFTNAVLRRVIGGDDAQQGAGERTLSDWLDEITAEEKDDEALGLRTAHPAWVVRALRQSMKLHSRLEDQDELNQLLEADNLSPEVHLIGLPGLEDDAGHTAFDAAIDAGATSSDLLEGAAIFRGGDIGRLHGVPEGTLRAQDIGSQWVAQALAEPAVQPGEEWLDLCAGPGGKAALLGALAAEYDVTLLANEPAEHRAELVRKALSPVNQASWDIRVGDGRTIAQDSSGPYDRILLDAPCTGLGALRRRPEARWRRKPSDLAELTVLQSELLDAAVEALAPEGLLAYVTCSPHIAETVVQVEDVLRRHPELQLLDAREPMANVALPAGAEAIEGAPVPDHDVAAKTVQLWPHVTGTDAMFFALLQKEA